MEVCTLLSVPHVRVDVFCCASTFLLSPQLPGLDPLLVAYEPRPAGDDESDDGGDDRSNGAPPELEPLWSLVLAGCAQPDGDGAAAGAMEVLLAHDVADEGGGAAGPAEGAASGVAHARQLLDHLRGRWRDVPSKLFHEDGRGLLDIDGLVVVEPDAEDELLERRLGLLCACVCVGGKGM